MSDWIGCIDSISELTKLPENWDSYGAIEINRESIDHAVKVVEVLSQLDTDVPYIIPCANGNVQLEWGDMELELEVCSDGSIKYLYKDEEGNTNLMGLPGIISKVTGE